MRLDLQHRIATTMRIGHVSLRLWIVYPMAVHDEAVFVAARGERQFSGPLAAADATQRCGPDFPVVERADYADAPGIGIQFKPNGAPDSLRLGFLALGLRELRRRDRFWRANGEL